MKYVLSLTITLFWLVGPTFAQNCQNASSVPADQVKVAAGTATAHYEGTTTFRGGQAVYVKVKNENVLGVSYELKIVRDLTPEVIECTYKAILLPKATAILWDATFAQPPVSWKVSVAVGEESDAGVLTYQAYSKTE
jgi:hypothetical protein